MKFSSLFIIVAAVLTLSLLPLCSSQTEVYALDENVELKFICTLNNEIPSASTQFNITISYPNGTTFISNQNTTPLGNGAFSYMTRFPVIGIYQVQVFCWDGAYSYSDIGTYEITLTGTKQSDAQATGSLAFLFLMIFLMVFFGWLGLTLVKNSYLWVAGIFFLFLCVLFLVYNTYLGYEYHLLLTGMPTSQTPEIIFYIFMFLMLAGILVSLALLIVHWKKIFRYIKREIKRKEDNYEDIEDWDYENWSKGHELNYGHFSPSGK